MAQDPTEAQQAAMLLRMLQQQAEAKKDDAPKGPTWQVVTEIVNVDSKGSTIKADIFGKTVTGAIQPLPDRYVTNQVDEGADLLFKLQFSEKIKIEEITFYCKPHSSNDNNNSDNANANADGNADANADGNGDANNENKDNADAAEADGDAAAKPVCPRRLYFAKSAETLSNYFENTIISRDDAFEDNELSLVKLNDDDLTSDKGFTISFSKQRPKVFKGTGLRTNTLVFGITHLPNQLDDDDDDDTDLDMDGDEKYQEKSIYLSAMVIRAAGQMSSKQDFEAQRKQIEKIKKGDS